MQRVLAITGVVGRVGEQIAIIARRKGADRHELLSFGHFVHGREELLRWRRGSALAAEDRILLPLNRARVIEIIAPAIRHVDVGLFDVAEHFVVELFLKPAVGFIIAAA